MCLNHESIEPAPPPAFPTPWVPFGAEMETRQIGPKDFETRYVSQAAADRAVARFALECMGRRVCDRCLEPFLPGIWGSLCDRCSRTELTEREQAEQMGRTA